MQEFLLIALIAFICFGFLRRVIYFQAYNSFTKAAQDFQRQHQKRNKPEGTVTVESAKKRTALKDEGEYVDYEEIK